MVQNQIRMAITGMWTGLMAWLIGQSLLEESGFAPEKLALIQNAWAAGFSFLAGGILGWGVETLRSRLWGIRQAPHVRKQWYALLIATTVISTATSIGCWLMISRIKGLDGDFKLACSFLFWFAVFTWAWTNWKMEGVNDGNVGREVRAWKNLPRESSRRTAKDFSRLYRNTFS